MTGFIGKPCQSEQLLAGNLQTQTQLPPGGKIVLDRDTIVRSPFTAVLPARVRRRQSISADPPWFDGGRIQAAVTQNVSSLLQAGAGAEHLSGVSVLQYVGSGIAFRQAATGEGPAPSAAYELSIDRKFERCAMAREQRTDRIPWPCCGAAIKSAEKPCNFLGGQA